jgi:hypothetical protein
MESCFNLDPDFLLRNSLSRKGTETKRIEETMRSYVCDPRHTLPREGIMAKLARALSLFFGEQTQLSGLVRTARS